MPFIRDQSFNYTTSTTGTTISIPLPNYNQNDLLIAFLVADTGTTATWSSSGWSSYVSSGSTVHSSVFYKIAGASESDPTFTRTVSETFHGVIVSIGDVDTATPFNANTTKAASTALTSFPTASTNRNNCLILWYAAHSTAAVPSVIVGPTVGLYGVDGSAESSGVGWGIQRSSGTTASDVYAATLSASAQFFRTIAVNPPSGGATVIPTYCAADSSLYLDPLNGTTAYNSNTSAAQDPTTIFGTTLTSLTITSDVATAVTDYGLNSFHSVARITADGSTPVTWRATRMQFAAGNKPNITGKGLTVHTGPSTPGQYQRIRNIASASGKGIAVGLASSAGNWKVWHTHGAGTPFGFSRDIPLIIHPSNTTGVIDSAGTLDITSVSDVAFFVSTLSISTSAWDFYSMWALDTITIAGGNSTYPTGIPGIVTAVQGHEHRGVIQQGINQLLILMPIQLGDGGTNGIYLDLNATAIEFPKQYSIDDKLVNFCAVDNWAGITYYAGASDTIKHRNSVISSSSRYKWGLHASSSTSASYDFSGLQVIGAGTISLARAITITELTISDYSTIDATGLTLTYSDILSVPSSNDSITLTPASNVDYCNINVSTVTAGNRWCSVADPSIFTYCTFTGGGGHAIRITSGGTYSFTGNTFTGFGADGSTGAAILNDSGDLVTLNVSGGVASPTYKNGTNATTVINNNVNVTVLILNQAGDPIPGVHVAIFQDNTSRTVVLASTPTNASGQVTTTAGNSLGPIIIRARQSTNKATFSTSQSFVSEVLTTTTNHNFNTGDAVIYGKNGGSANIGLSAGTTYYVNYVSANTLMLYNTATNAIAGGATGKMDLTTSGSETHILDPIRYVAGSAKDTIGSTDFNTQITLITDTIATG